MKKILCLLLLFLATFANAELILYWNMDEGSGNTLADSATNSNAYTGTMLNMSSNDWVNGISGKALDFDGVNDYVINNNGPALGNEIFGSGHDGTVSYSIWFYARSSGVIVDEVNETGAWHDSQIEILSTGEVKARVWSVLAVSLGTVSFNAWHHAILRYNKSTNTLDGFIDGTEASSDVTGSRTDPYNYSGHAFYPLGKADTTSLGDGSYFNGILDEFRIYNHALSTAEVQELYNNPAEVPEPASIALFLTGTILCIFYFKKN